MHSCTMHLPRLLVKKSARVSKGSLLIFILVVVIGYHVYYYNVWEYVRTTPFSNFEYPLEVDMPGLVQRVLKQQPPGYEPLNNIHAFPFVINSDKKCKDEDGNEEAVFLLVMIKSRLENFEQRRMIRRTWGREYGVASLTVRRIFLMGVRPSDKNLQHRIGLEQQDFGDIVQQYFHDTYFNNTVKILMGFQWAVEYCTNARFIAFFDDDYYVNINNVIKTLQVIKPTEYDNLVVGYVWKNAMPYRIKDSKWYVSLQEYPFRFFPPYVTAGSFFVPMMTAERLFIAMQYTKLIRFDDVFLGIVMWKLKTKLRHDSNLYFFDYPYDAFTYRKVIAAHGFSDTEVLYKAWKEQTDLDKLH